MKSGRSTVQEELDHLRLRAIATDFLLRHMLAEQLRRPVAAKELAAALRQDVDQLRPMAGGDKFAEIVESLLQEAEALAARSRPPLGQAASPVKDRLPSRPVGVANVSPALVPSADAIPFQPSFGRQVERFLKSGTPAANAAVVYLGGLVCALLYGLDGAFAHVYRANQVWHALMIWLVFALGWPIYAIYLAGQMLADIGRMLGRSF